MPTKEVINGVRKMRVSAGLLVASCELRVAAYSSFGKFLNLNLTFAVFRKRDA